MLDDFERYEKEQDYLDKYIFKGLVDLNDGFDATSIRYFSASDFETVLCRIKELGLGIYGIEPWKQGEFFGVETYEDYADDPTDYNWYLKVFKHFKEADAELQYSASYYIPEHLLTT